MYEIELYAWIRMSSKHNSSWTDDKYVHSLKMYIKDDDFREIIISVGWGYPLWFDSQLLLPLSWVCNSRMIQLVIHCSHWFMFNFPQFGCRASRSWCDKTATTVCTRPHHNSSLYSQYTGLCQHYSVWYIVGILERGKYKTLHRQTCKQRMQWEKNGPSRQSVQRVNEN